jgi:hypothetical protein
VEVEYGGDPGGRVNRNIYVFEASIRRKIVE